MDIAIGILLSIIVNRLLGNLWYSSYLWGNHWARLEGFALSRRDFQKLLSTELLGSFRALVIASALLTALLVLEISSPLKAVGVAAFLWAGFTAPVQIGGVLWDKKPLLLFLINGSHQLLSIVLMALILAAVVKF